MLFAVEHYTDWWITGTVWNDS